MPSQKELRWSQLKVGILALAAFAALTVLIFLMSGSTGGLFTRKIHLKAYFGNANGLKVGAPVTLDGVTVGNVTSVRIMPAHEVTPVEVMIDVSKKFMPSLHTDSTAAIDQAGVLGDAFLDISSIKARGPQPADNSTLPTAAIPGIQDVIRTSQGSIEAVTDVIHRVGMLVDTINSGQGTAGVMLNDPVVAKKIVRTIDQLQALTNGLSSGKGTLGKLLTDDELYTRANSTITKLDTIATELQSGQGSAGKLLKDDTLYKNLNSAIENTNALLAGINSGKGSLGKLAKDPAFAEKVETSLDHLNTLLQGMNEGKGSLGQFVVNRSMYDSLDKTVKDTGELVTGIRKNPKTYLTVHVKLF